MTPQQARQELARRELARRQADSSAQPQDAIGQTEQVISERPSAIGQMRQEFGTSGVPSMFGGKNPMQQAAMALGEAVRGVPADILLAIQSGRMGDIPKDIASTFRGERPAQVGDVMRASGNPVLASPPARFLANNVDLLMGLRQANPRMIEDIAGAVRSGVQSGVQGVRNAGSNMVNLLRGNPAGIEAADRRVSETTQSLIRSYRKGGLNHEQATRALGEVADQAWEPARKAAQSVPVRIQTGDLRQIAMQKFSDPDDVQRLNAVLDSIDQLEKATNLNSFNATDLLDMSSKLGQKMSKPGVRGMASRSMNDTLLADRRSLLLDAIEQAAPEDAKGLISEAFGNWRKYATVRNQFFKTVRPYAAQEELVGAGGNTLRNAAGVGKVEPNTVLDAETIAKNIREMFGLDLTGPIQPSASALRQAESVGRRGERFRRGITFGVPAAGGLLALLGRRGKPTE